MCLRAYKPEIKPVYMKREKPDCKSINNAKKLQYPFLLLTNILMLRIGELKSNLYFSDKKIEYISLDTSINGIEALVAYTN